MMQGSASAENTAPFPEKPASTFPFWAGWLPLLLYCGFMFGGPIVANPPLSTHEAVHCQNVREMLASGDWIIPTYGGRVWLERPPLPHWLTALFVAGFPDEPWPWVFRLGSLVAGTLATLAVVDIARSLRFSGQFALFCGAVYASMLEVVKYASGAECDITLALIVTSALACFIRAEFREPIQERWSLLGSRSMAVLGFFILTGLANVAKGLFFGMVMTLVPVTLYLLFQLSWSSIRKYVWLWGWLAFLVAGSWWGLWAYLREPGVVDLWMSDYVGRLNEGYMKEPKWYYLAQLPWVIFPWTLAAMLGLIVTVRPALRSPRSVERLLVVWSCGTLAFLTVPQGKHHHYLLPTLAPWAVLAAVGARTFWQWFRDSAPWYVRHQLLLPSLFTLLAVTAIVVMHQQKPEMVRWPIVYSAVAALFITLFWWGYRRQEGRNAAIATLLLIGVGSNSAYWYHAKYEDVYGDDAAFGQRIHDRSKAGEKIVVMNDMHPLDASWILTWLPTDTQFFHNHTYLQSTSIDSEELYVVAKLYLEPFMAAYGDLELVDQSRTNRYGEASIERWALYRFRFHPDLERVEPQEAITPMQSTGRAVGPFLGPAPLPLP